MVTLPATFDWEWVQAGLLRTDVHYPDSSSVQGTSLMIGGRFSLYFTSQLTI